MFKAVGDLESNTSGIENRFDARVGSLATGVFGIDVADKTTADLVDEIKIAFNKQISTHLSGDIAVVYKAPKCSAAVDVAVSAQAKCEAKAGCDVDASIECDPGKLAFHCEGQCSGSCSAGCEGSCTV